MYCTYYMLSTIIYITLVRIENGYYKAMMLSEIVENNSSFSCRCKFVTIINILVKIF